MQLRPNRRRGATLAFVLATATATLPVAGAQAHFSFGHYTYKQRDNGGCLHHVDPVNTVFYGSKAFARSVKHNIGVHLGWHNRDGGRQYFATHGRCYAMDFQRASGGSTDTRFHIRVKQGYDKDKAGRFESVGDAHHEDFVHDINCNFFAGNHAVDSNGSRGSGFDQGRYQVARRFRARHHAVKYKYWGNTEKFHQCDGDWASSNGLVAWINVPHFTH